MKIYFCFKRDSSNWINPQPFQKAYELMNDILW